MFFEGRLEWPSRDASVVRLKVEWVSSLARLVHRLKWGLRRRIILQFNKLINVIWQVVSSALGGSRHSLQSHLRACSITMLTKAWTGSEREMTAIWGWLWYSRSATQKGHTGLRGVSLRQIYCILQNGSPGSYCREQTASLLTTFW